MRTKKVEIIGIDWASGKDWTATAEIKKRNRKMKTEQEIREQIKVLERLSNSNKRLIYTSKLTKFEHANLFNEIKDWEGAIKGLKWVLNEKEGEE